MDAIPEADVYRAQDAERTIASMTLIELFWFVFFVGGGGFAGFRLGGFLGALVGAPAGLLLSYAITRAADWEDSQTPVCVCGAAWEELRDEWEGSNLLHRCTVCGRRYEMRHPVWLELTPEGESVPRMRRSFLGKWRPVR